MSEEDYKLFLKKTVYLFYEKKLRLPLCCLGSFFLDIFVKDIFNDKITGSQNGFSSSGRKAVVPMK